MLKLKIANGKVITSNLFRHITHIENDRPKTYRCTGNARQCSRYVNSRIKMLQQRQTSDQNKLYHFKYASS